MTAKRKHRILWNTRGDDFDYEALEADLEELERTDPDVAAAAENYRRARDRIVNREIVIWRAAAQFDGPVHCGHHVNRGDTIARTIDGRYICEQCAP